MNMNEPVKINACPRGHRYRSFLRTEERRTCPSCDQIALVALAYGDCQQPRRSCRLLTFRTEHVTSMQHLAELLSLVPGYNAWDASRVIRELSPVFPRLSGIEFGREGSPVLYATIPFWTHQAIKWVGSGMGERIPSEERGVIAGDFLKAMERADADELTFDGHRARAWWD
jgi:hypothetical protein